MPADPDQPRYEAFLVLPDAAAHWVVAIAGDQDRTQARRFARLDDHTGAARLADALNARILGRRNHAARLRAALAGLPFAVYAAVRRVPIGNRDGVAATDLLAELLPDPIDGLLLFSTAPGSAITPRTAQATAFAADDLGDLCHEVALTGGTTDHPFGSPLPVSIRRRRPEQLMCVAAQLDRVAAALRAGLLPELRTPAERHAARLAVDHAEQVYTADPKIFAISGRLLPSAPHDYDFAALRCQLPDDTGRARAARISLPTT